MISSSKKSLQTVSKLSAAIILSSLTLYSSASYADQAYGPVRANDTLSKIVNRYYVGPKRSTMELMREIVKQNPQAFVRGDMNLLKRNALLTLPGNDWLSNEATFVSPDNKSIAKLAQAINIAPAVPAVTQSVESNKLGVQDRLVFLEAERTSLISQVAELKRENDRLKKKVDQLELQSKASDEQLRLLDAEIIRVTKLLNGSKGEGLTTADISQIEALQQQLKNVQQETQSLKAQLQDAQTELSNNNYVKEQADKTIAQLTLENEQLNALIKDTQPGVHYFGESESGSNLSLLSGKFKLPVWSVIAGGALLSLILIALLSTRRRKPELPLAVSEHQNTVPENTFEDLLETQEFAEERGFTQSTVAEPEENVYKMFDEGSLEMDLKLDMAKAYLEVSDFMSARAVLTEVIEGGSELQKRQANRLMKQAA